MKIFLDDERPAPSGWTLMRWPHEVIAALQTHRVTEISLDHDLGDDAIGTGYDVLVWLESTVAHHSFALSVIHIHTPNSAARPRMLAAVAQIQRLAQTHLPAQANQRRDETPHPVALAALPEDAEHPARWPSWYDHTGSSEPARQWVESIYAVGASKTTLTLCPTAEMLPWHTHQEVRAWLATSTAQQPCTLGHSGGRLPRQAA